MILSLYKGYPDFIGKRQAFVGSGTGPTSYNATTGDVVSLSLTNHYIDFLASGMPSLSGTYFVRALPAGTGERQAWSFHWFVTATGLEVTTISATNLSGETIVAGGFCGSF